jgi:hypothetical protein
LRPAQAPLLAKEADPGRAASRISEKKGVQQAPNVPLFAEKRVSAYAAGSFSAKEAVSAERGSCTRKFSRVILPAPS